MNRSAAELGLAVLVVSQFTLYADTTRGRRPSFVQAAPPERAQALVERVVSQLEGGRGDGGHGPLRRHDAGAAGQRGPGDDHAGDLTGPAGPRDLSGARRRARARRQVGGPAS